LLSSALSILLSTVSFAQKINITGKVTGPAARVVKEVQFFCDGKMQRLLLDTINQTFAGNIKINEAQFVEIKSGNPKPQVYYLIPNEKITLTIDKPSLQESVIVISNNKTKQLQDIFETYHKALQEKGIDTRKKDWPQLLFLNDSPIAYAEDMLKKELAKSASIIAAIPNFKKDMFLFMTGFRNYVRLDKMTLPEIDSALQKIKEANLKNTMLNIPFYKDYLTDISNAFASRSLDKYGISIDFVKQKHVSQFLAAEAITKYINDHTIKSYLFSEKLKVELPTNGLKNEAYVYYLLNNSDQFVKDFYKEKIETLKANKTPDLNAARKKAYDFQLYNADGKEYRLADFKGKMLFIDFWASWCAPCKAQIPYQKELEKKYEGKDIVFASVSLDKSKEAWLKAVKDEELHGIVLHAEGDFKNPFPKAYAIDAIPRYMLIDAAGNIISDNMMKPQNKKEITGVIDEELYAKNTNAILEKHFAAIGAETFKKNGLEMDYRQSVVSFNSKSKLYYSYPNKVKSILQFEETPQMLMILGEDFFSEKYAVLNGDSVRTNNPGFADIKNTWTSKIFGMELFLRKSIDNSVIKFAEDNTTNTDSCYVLKLINNGKTEKYYINKNTFLIDKVTSLSNVEARKGGGITEAITYYEDYRKVNGVMIPFKINQANIISIKIDKAEIKPIDDSIFQ